MTFLNRNPTPIQELLHPIAISHGVRVMVLREDLNHPTVSGNKWWKLKYNLIAAKERQSLGVLTFGGAYSNHIYATAAACSEVGLRSIGIIRGEETLPLNPTLAFARSRGMEIRYISRQNYRSRNDANFIDHLKKEVGNFYFIPEGGTNSLAVKGCAELYKTFEHLPFDKLIVPVGTGGTIAGLIAASSDGREMIGVTVLKDGEFLKPSIDTLLEEARVPHSTFRLATEYHFGGYAKANHELLEFIQDLRNYDLPVDHVYTGKMFFALFQEIKKGNIKRGETVLTLHTGGLQGSVTFQA